jgi:hypothetical protein
MERGLSLRDVNKPKINSSNALLFSSGKKNVSYKKTKKNYNEEIDEISISTIELLLKKNKTKEEEAYLLALKEYYQKIKEEMKKKKKKVYRSPHVFILDESERSEEEKIYYLKMYQKFYERMKEKNKIYQQEVQMEILKCSKELFEKNNKTQLEEEYCQKILQQSRDLDSFQIKYGVFVKYDTISSCLLYLKPEELMTQREMEFLKE